MRSERAKASLQPEFQTGVGILFVSLDNELLEFNPQKLTVNAGSKNCGIAKSAGAYPPGLYFKNRADLLKWMYEQDE